MESEQFSDGGRDRGSDRGSDSNTSPANARSIEDIREIAGGHVTVLHLPYRRGTGYGMLLKDSRR